MKARFEITRCPVVPPRGMSWCGASITAVPRTTASDPPTARPRVVSAARRPTRRCACAAFGVPRFPRGGGPPGEGRLRCPALQPGAAPGRERRTLVLFPPPGTSRQLDFERRSEVAVPHQQDHRLFLTVIRQSHCFFAPGHTITSRLLVREGQLVWSAERIEGQLV